MSAELVDYVKELEQRVLAQEKTINVLIKRHEQRDATSSSAHAVFEQNIALERVVANRTRMLATQHAKLEKAMEQLVMTQAHLVHAQKLESIGILAAGVAHELNTPAQYVYDNMHFLREGFEEFITFIRRLQRLVNEPPPEAKEVSSNCFDQLRMVAQEIDIDYLCQEIPCALSETMEGISQISHIVQAMKRFSHPGSDEKEKVDINQAMRDALSVSKNSWKEVATLDLQLDPMMPGVFCNIGDIKQVLLNIIINAVHAMTDAYHQRKVLGTMTITSSHSDGMVVLSITDTGLGIPDEIANRIFDPFFTTKKVGYGTGQGLAISRDIIMNKHGGELSFISEVNVGTTFFIRLPCSLGAPRETDGRDDAGRLSA